MYRDRDYFPAGINCYVPGMQLDQGASDHVVDLPFGALTAADADGIDDGRAGDTANDTVVLAGAFVVGSGGDGAETPAKYGRNIEIIPSGAFGTGGLDLDVYGFDYLGQPMVERLNLGAAQTAKTVGKKAFKRIEKTILVNNGANAQTYDLGWGYLFGVPYKIAELLSVNEGGKRTFPDAFTEGDGAAQQLGAGTGTSSHVVPLDGYIIGFDLVYTAAQTSATAGLSATVNGEAAAGLAFEAPVATVGAHVENKLTKSSWIPVKKGDVVVFTSDGDGDTGTASLSLMYSHGAASLQQADETDPASRTTQDPRGLIDFGNVPNGTREYWVTYLASTLTNSNGNGGLHGIQQFYP